MTANIRDVARIAGVSISTVSKVFNEYTDVNKKTKERVLEIAKQIDYAPNMAARTLSSKKQKTIALILSELNINRKSTMPLEVLSGVYKYTEQKDFEFVFYGTSTEKQKEKTFRQFCNEHNIAGAVVQGLKMTDSYYQEIKATDIPTVLIDIDIKNPYVGTVFVDNEQAAFEAVEYLISQNHNNIGVINGSRDVNVSILRENGYRRALMENNIQINEAYIQYANFEEDIAFLMAQNLLKNNKDITALFCISDIMAIGAIRGLKEMGLNVPDDISIIGFDDIVLSKYVTPALTTIAQDAEALGFESAKLLSEIISGNTDVPKRHIIPHELKYRDSVNKNERN